MHIREKPNIIIVISILMIVAILLMIFSNSNDSHRSSSPSVAATVEQILTTGKWEWGDSITLNFTDKKYTAVRVLNGKKEKITCAYEITDITFENEVYELKCIMTDTDGNDFDVTDIKIATLDSERYGNLYYLYSTSLPFSSIFRKGVNI